MKLGRSHTSKTYNSSITKHAVTWNSQGWMKRVRPIFRATWRRTTEQEMKVQGLSWQQLEA